MTKKTVLIFIIIFILAGWLRFYDLTNNPPSLNWDEVSLGFNAYSILLTGRDEWGKVLPLSFRAFGDYKLPGYIYLDAPFIAVFGLSEVGVRLPSALAGLGTVFFIFLIIKQLTANYSLALWGVFLAATTPWLIIFSRTALEANLALCFVTAAIYCLLVARDNQKFLILSAVLLGLSFFTYNSSRVVTVPLVLLATLNFKKNLLINKWTIGSACILTVFILTALPHALLQDSSARYRWTQIIDEGAIAKINQLRATSSFSPSVNKLVFNKITYFIPESAKNYFSHFNPSFLFFQGGSNYQYSVPGWGLFPWLTLPLLLLGFWQILRKKESWQIFIVGWLLVAPLPGAITRDAPHSLRSLFMIPPLLIIMTLGVEFFYLRLRPFVFQLVQLGLVAGILVLTVLFWQTYTVQYRQNYSWSWQYGYKQAINFVKDNEATYEKIVITKKYGEPHIFTLFYTGFDPGRYLSDGNLNRYYKSDWWWVDSFSKYEFVNDWEIISKTTGSVNTLLVTTPGNFPPQATLLTTIKFLNGQAAFDIVRL